MDELPDQYEPTSGWRLLGLALCAGSAWLVVWLLVWLLRPIWKWATS